MKSNTRFCIYAGLVPFVWFLFWVSVGGVLAPGYDLSSQHASELLGAGGMAALCVRIGVIGTGLAFIVFSIGVMALSRFRPAIGALGYFVFGCSMISNGIWPLGDPMHGLYAAGVLTMIAPALAHIELAHILGARRDYLLTAFVSVAGIVYLWLNLTGNDGSAFRGLTQRVFSSINSLWPFVVALKLLRQDGLALPTKAAAGAA